MFTRRSAGAFGADVSYRLGRQCRRTHLGGRVVAAHPFSLRKAVHPCERRWHGNNSRFTHWSRCQAGSSESPETDSAAFDLATAVALAGCSFESYLEPQGSEELHEVNANGTMTTYTDRNYIVKTFDGLLEVQVKGASDLPARDFMGLSDPYTIVSVGEGTAKTQTVPQDLNPVWNETFYLYVRDFNKDVLRIRLLDADVIKSDDSLGVTMYPIRAVAKNKYEELSLDLQGDGGGGKINIDVRYLPFEDTESEAFMDYDTEDLDSVLPVEGPGDLIEEVVADLPGGNLFEQIPESSLPEVWKSLAVMAGKRAEDRFDPVCFIENENTDSQLWVYSNTDRQECVVAFRGTEQVKWKDLATDANLQPAKLDVERTDTFKPLTLRLLKQASSELQVHKGFLDAYDSVKAQVFRIVDDITGKDPEWVVYVTGHSLGGALATLFAFELATRGSSQKRPEVRMYNFGSPRVGNRAFADAFNKAVPVSWRVTNRRDLVPTVPRLMGYKHVESPVIISRTGELDFGRKGRVDVLEGRAMAEVVTEISEKVKNVEGNLEEISKELSKEVMDPLVGHELELLSDLMDGSGLAEHMEDIYLESMKECVTVAAPMADNSESAEA